MGITTLGITIHALQGIVLHGQDFKFLRAAMGG